MLLEADILAGSVHGAGSPLLLSRALCRYRHFRAPPGLTWRQVANAARTFAQAHAPFSETGTLLMRTPAGAGIWWWDAARIAAACGGKAPGVVVPETVLRGAGEAWRVVACAEGVEAQYWEDGTLLASSWRREPFTREQWVAFALGVEAPASAAPLAAPEPIELPLRRGGAWRRHWIKPAATWRDAEAALATVALCAAALAAFFAGQGLRQDNSAAADTRAAAAIEARIGADPAMGRVREQTALLQAYDAALGDGDVLAAAADAFAALAQFGQQPEGWQVEAGALRVRVLAASGDMQLREIVAALEATESLCEVEPTFQPDAVAFAAKLGAVCGAGQ